MHSYIFNSSLPIPHHPNEDSSRYVFDLLVYCTVHIFIISIVKVHEKLDNLVILVNLPKMPLPLPKRPDVKKGYAKLLLITQKNQPNTMLLPHYFNASKLLINMKSRPRYFLLTKLL